MEVAAALRLIEQFHTLILSLARHTFQQRFLHKACRNLRRLGME